MTEEEKAKLSSDIIQLMLQYPPRDAVEAYIELFPTLVFSGVRPEHRRDLLQGIYNYFNNTIDLLEQEDSADNSENIARYN